LTIAAIISKRKDDVSNQIINMLKAMKYNKKIFSVATHKELVINENIESINLKETERAIGYNGVSIERLLIEKQLEKKPELCLAFEGYILNNPMFHEGAQAGSEFIFSLIDNLMNKCGNLYETIKIVLPMLRGAFSFTIMGGKTVVAARDILGFEPLYWGENEQYIAFVSEKKALWTIGLRDIKSLPPGYIAVLGEGTMNMTQVLSLKRPQILEIDLDAAAERLVALLKKVFSRYFGEISEVNLLFSGGLDSSIMAKVLCNMGINVKLYGAAFEGAHDINAITRSASELGCIVHLQTLSLEEIERYLYRTIYTVEEASVMKAGVGLPLYASMEAANIQG